MNAKLTDKCEAIRTGDDMSCGRCAMVWGADEEPPVCKPVKRDARAQALSAALHMSSRFAPVAAAANSGYPTVAKMRAGFQEQRELLNVLSVAEPRLFVGGKEITECLKPPALERPPGDPLPVRRPGCYNEPRPVVGAVTHFAQDGWDERRDDFGSLVERTPRWVPIIQREPAPCRYDRRSTDAACTGCKHAVV